MLFDDDASGAFHHMKLYLQSATVHSYSTGQTICVPIGLAFGTNVSSRHWEVLTRYHCEKSEYLHSYPDLSIIVQKHGTLIGLIKILEDTHTFSHLLVLSSMEKINKGLFIDEEWGPTQHAMSAD